MAVKAISIRCSAVLTCGGSTSRASNASDSGCLSRSAKNLRDSPSCRVRSRVLNSFSSRRSLCTAASSSASLALSSFNASSSPALACSSVSRLVMRCLRSANFPKTSRRSFAFSAMVESNNTAINERSRSCPSVARRSRRVASRLRPAAVYFPLFGVAFLAVSSASVGLRLRSLINQAMASRRRFCARARRCLFLAARCSALIRTTRSNRRCHTRPKRRTTGTV